MDRSMEREEDKKYSLMIAGYRAIDGHWTDVQITSLCQTQ